MTTQGKTIVDLWQGSWIAALIVGVLVWGLIVWTVIFHRKRSDRVPRQVRYNLPIEIMYTVVPFIMVGVLFFFTARDENQIDTLSAHPAVVVNVTGFQWSWAFQYPQYRVQRVQGAVRAGRRVRGRPDLERGRSPATRARCRCWRSPSTRRSGSTWSPPT